jgi:hypothetical protein
METENDGYENEVLDDIARDVEDRLFKKTGATNWSELSQEIDGLTSEAAARAIKYAIKRGIAIGEEQASDGAIRSFYEKPHYLAIALEKLVKKYPNAIEARTALDKYNTKRKAWLAEHASEEEEES